MASHYVGQRLATKGELCTVRYVGTVAGKKGSWLGVEWDDSGRGKHSGTFDGVEYFQCRSSALTAGSFIRPSAVWDRPRTVLEATKAKYSPDDQSIDVSADSHSTSTERTIWISGKQVEEIGYEKISRKQAKLELLRNAILDGMLLSGQADQEIAFHDLSHFLPNVSQLDLSRNMFETINEITSICAQLPKLTTLVLDGNRLHTIPIQAESLPQITSLSLNTMLLSPPELADILTLFPSLNSLSISGNAILSNVSSCGLPTNLQLLKVEDARFTSLREVALLTSNCDNLVALDLKNNLISDVFGFFNSKNITNLTFPQPLRKLDLSRNEITSFKCLDDLATLMPQLHDLMLSHNPIYKCSRTPSGKKLTEFEVSSLVVARLPNLRSLNYSPVTPKEKLNGEKLYLALAAEDASQHTFEDENQILSQYPRYKELCEEYGEPLIYRINDDTVDPNTLAARLIQCRIYTPPSPHSRGDTERPHDFTIEIPKSFNTYTVLGLVGRRLGIYPQDMRLIWETEERDPVASIKGKQSVQEWDSEDEDDPSQMVEWTNREVEVTPGTRPLGTIIETSNAVIRVETKAR